MSSRPKPNKGKGFIPTDRKACRNVSGKSPQGPKPRVTLMSTAIRFLLNDQEMTTNYPTGMLVLDFLRRQAELMGTKEGCKEGDCGACVVMIGSLQGKTVRYLPVTSCLMPIGELAGKHLVTIEGLNMAALSPVQEAIVHEGGTQCGFCTPGIVVSLTARVMQQGPAMNAAEVKYALSGHLCRCTGYNSLKRAGGLITAAARKLKKNGRDGGYLAAMVEKGMLPPYFLQIPQRLRRLQSEIAAGQPNGRPAQRIWVAGGTDIYVQRGEEIPDLTAGILNRHPQMKGISRRGQHIHIGALTTFEEFSGDPLIGKIIAEMPQFMHVNASWQIRNRATLGGNIVNASPIGDMTNLLLVLDSVVVLKNGRKQRRVPLREFYRGYKQIDKSPQEILTEIIFEVPAPAARINFEKVSKRRCLDIASVNSSILIEAKNDVITKVNLSVGGVAPIPLLLRRTAAFLTGKPITPATLSEALAVAQGEISPISDIRGSAEYKRLLTRQLILAHFCKLFPQRIRLADFVAAESADPFAGRKS